VTRYTDKRLKKQLAKQARKDAEADMKREGFATEPCRHKNTGTKYVFPGNGWEYCTKWCSDCGKILRRWTNHRKR